MGVGVGDLIETPLLQTNFFPDLIQVYVLFPTTDLLLIFVHLAPAFTAAFTGLGWKVSATHNIKRVVI